MGTFADLLARFGLPLVFLGAAVEGDVTPLLAGVTAHLGLLRLPFVMATAWVGLNVGDLAWFGLGWWQAERWRTTGLYRRTGPVIERYVDRVGIWELLLARVIYGTRIASMLYWGSRRVSPTRFLAVNALGSGVWVGALTPLGYFLSDQAQALVGDVERAEHWLLGAALLAIAGVLAWRTMSRRTPRTNSGPRRPSVDVGPKSR